MKATYYNVSIQHFILDMIGFVPVVGDIVDTVHAVWYAMEGDYWDAAMSAISVLPIIGDMVGVGGKAAVKIGKSIKNGDNIGDIIKSVEKVAGKTGGNAAEKAGSKAAKEAAEEVAEEAAEKGTKKTASEAAEEVAGGVGKSSTDVIPTLGKKALKHPLNTHMPSKVAQQFEHMSEQQIAKYLEDNTFFNKSWTETQITDALNYGYKKAIDSGISTGGYSFSYEGEKITVYLTDGTFNTGYGHNVYTYEEIMSSKGR